MGLLDSAKDALNGEQGEKITDSAISKGEETASSKTGGKFDDRIDATGNAADKKIGND
ncbi:antitoxin (plasmid) [Frigoribacterium sp. NBH87]|uniref:Rv0909 family putative TA system antitoxin n=1 Tax=Frigoribacterium sp. NBH87 TaxID=2596916 RepID=UPI0016249673|nr:Rv0909 family putative TA system antitoxin [Frigoribacterium sp. NBH87]QNE45392.1 antitoxin [Frigoribacterium sp. NBH87]